MESKSNGCITSKSNKKLTTEEFIARSKKVHGDKYDYSKSIYLGRDKKVCIICPKHREFWQRADHHLSGHNCPFCSGRGKTTEQFIQQAKKIHGDRYDYSKVEYLGSHKKVCIICPEHGEFWQYPYNHLRGATCKKCQSLNTEEWIELANKIHNNKYDYSQTIYKNTYTKVKIICPEHGEFWQRPDHHLSGFGCPHCSKSKMENNVCVELQKNGIQYIIQKDFPWLKYKNNLHIDIYLPEYNIAIECQGGQHFYPVDFYGGDEEYRMICERDKLKYDLCKKNGIRVLYYTDVKLEEYPYDVITDLDELIKRIKNY